MTPLITQAVALLRQGKLVAFPTETVYGLGADACNESAIRKIFQVKKRPLDHPLIVHIGGIEKLSDFACDVSPDAMKLASAFWPGPLTMILKKSPQVLEVVTAGQQTIGLRIPNHPIAQALLQAFGAGIAAPSANQFTHVSPTDARAVYEELGKEVDLILDGGICEVGLESTIIDMSANEPLILRPGMITPKMIGEVLGVEIKSRTHHFIKAPGQYHLHYAPVTKTVLIPPREILQSLHRLETDDFPVAVMSRATGEELALSSPIHWVTMPIEASHYAHDLYHTLRMLDQKHFKQIMIEAVPDGIEWEAIRDRLLKATAERST